ncbi:MAG: hypothetical protein H7256_06120 [Bdellovibrio sp.]|nr:hypothetical protein [Bdellovibrio sp.]
MNKSTQTLTIIIFFFSVTLLAQGKDSPKKDSRIKEEMTTVEFEAVKNSCGSSVEGTTREGFSSETTSGALPCPKAIQTCTGGQWVGPKLYYTCANDTKSCGPTPHGDVVNGFRHATASKGKPCEPAFKTCLNGAWVGPEVIPSCAEAP